MWSKVLPLLLLVATQISRLSSEGSSPNDTISLTTLNVNSELGSSHRIIRRFAPRFKLPKPQLPTLPRPELPFPMFSRNPPKGENENKPMTSNKKRKRPAMQERDRPPGVQEDRTLLAAKKAILLKKAIIAKKAFLLAKLKKKAVLKKKKKKKLKKKATIAYKLNKLSKLKGVSFKAPNVHVTFGGPKKPTKLTGEESSEAYGVDNVDVESNSSSGSEESGSDEEDDDDDDDDDLDEDDDDDKPKQQVQGAIIITPEPAPSPQQTAQQVPVALQNTMPTIQQQSSQNSVSMMQQLQQQLQQKQQEQLTQQQQLQLLQAQQQQQQLQLLQAQQQQQQAQNQQGIVITASLSPTAVPTEVPEDYGSKKGKKKGKKKKKKKKKSTPRPVNLGVKANLIKKFDKLTKKAHNKLSSFIQIDIDFFRSGQGRSAIDHLVEPGRFLPRTARISENSYESLEDYDYVSGLEVPVNFIPPWVTPTWKREYPSRERKNSDASNLCNNEHTASCALKPVYILFKQE